MSEVMEFRLTVCILVISDDNRALYWTVFSLHSIAFGELCRYAAKSEEI